MKRKIIIGTMVIFAWSSLFLMMSCAKKQLITEEKIIKKPAAVKTVEKKKSAAEEVKKEGIEEAEKIRLERLKELEKAKKSEAEARNRWQERKSLNFEAEVIYFDFDRSFIRPEYRPILKEKADYLKDNPNVRIRIEGNCDERGTNEYNLALGERRANSANKFLVSLGVSPDQIEIVSYGEERPLALGHSKGAWAQNRRDDFEIITD
ncbi:MAG: peptidoglycan-associated lipoprotein Pal [Thermodesulfobacteriota bacterium]|nr:peptidoglycan-associated lipoprotein Pal [Thermodesulfobacteriota bacterium]